MVILSFLQVHGAYISNDTLYGASHMHANDSADILSRGVSVVSKLCSVQDRLIMVRCYVLATTNEPY